MVPGSTLRYGSSFCSETVRRRAFRMFPIDAAVMPLPREETTPPVTKTYFDIDDLQGGFSNVTGLGCEINPPADRRRPGRRAWAAEARSAPRSGNAEGCHSSLPGVALAAGLGPAATRVERGRRRHWCKAT